MNHSDHSGFYMYHLIYIENLHILPSQYNYVFRMTVTINGDYFPKQH
jgi:hypothetical protein